MSDGIAAVSDDLAAFLLARIAEDEANWSTRPGQSPLRPEFRPTADRILAECEAKRKIVETLTPATVNGFSMFPATVLEERILRLLALPYTDHPDYRASEWRP